LAGATGPPAALFLAVGGGRGIIRGQTVPTPSPKSSARNRRASPEAVAKRRAARAFNEVVLGPGPRAGDGRTERRRRRLLQELSEGITRTGHELKPIEVLLRVQALLELGETAASLARIRPVPAAVKTTPALVDGVRRLHQAYKFAAEAYQFVGVEDEALFLSGVRRGKRGPVKAKARPSGAAPRRGAA
jgi:hypothetical protein